jgi:alpha-beta hydrolase superfamily lysophospholipase
MRAKLFKGLKWTVALLAAGLVTLLGVRAWDSRSGPPLELWHTYAPDELERGQIGALDWAGYLAAEQKVFEQVRQNVTLELSAGPTDLANRYHEAAPIYPGRFQQDWNRSFVLEPAGEVKGAVVLLHGMTDAPYSLRHIGRHYQQRGFVAIGIRMPGHGTVPGGLAKVDWEDWAAATRLAVREAKRRSGADKPLHLVGFSNGAALAMNYALDALDEPGLARPDRLVLLSPMIGVTEMARFAGVLGWPAVLPAFARASWLGIVPEFNPFKYNSFPINGARQSSLLTRHLQQRLAQHVRSNGLADLPPVLTFQSVVDFTVSTRAVINTLYGRLPANGSELVLFDLNRSVKFGPFLRVNPDTTLARLLPEPPRAYRTSLVTNLSAEQAEVQERLVEANSRTELSRNLGLEYPFEVYSLSHVALPFPLSDSLYGMRPSSTDEDFGVHLGALAVRGERGALILTLDSLIRMSSNPFYDYVIERIDAGIVGTRQP